MLRPQLSPYLRLLHWCIIICIILVLDATAGCTLWRYQFSLWRYWFIRQDGPDSNVGCFGFVTPC